MTKKDYIVIAGAIHRSGMATGITEKNKIKLYAGEAMRRLIVIDLASSLRADNPKFDRVRFMEACGVTE